MYQNTHEKVRKRALGLIAMWAAEFEKDSTLGIMEECYDNLKAKSKNLFLPLKGLISPLVLT